MRKQELHPRTAVINKIQKNKSKKARSDALVWLAATFPSAFDNSIRIRPLKLGVMEDLLQYADQAAAVGISKSKLREAVVLFTRRLDYLACLKAREVRVDLQGNEVSTVTEEEASYAAAKIKKRVEKSLRNARKIAAENSASYGSTQSISSGFSAKAQSQSNASSEEYFPIYPPRSNLYNSAPAQQPAKTSAVIIKHKTTRQFDPNAVARLKEKLGISRSNLESKESTEH